jgi:hypothetical protein
MHFYSDKNDAAVDKVPSNKELADLVKQLGASMVAATSNIEV